jgi:hypothetical protein
MLQTNSLSYTFLLLAQLGWVKDADAAITEQERWELAHGVAVWTLRLPVALARENCMAFSEMSLRFNRSFPARLWRFYGSFIMRTKTDIAQSSRQTFRAEEDSAA